MFSNGSSLHYSSQVSCELCALYSGSPQDLMHSYLWFLRKTRHSRRNWSPRLTLMMATMGKAEMDQKQDEEGYGSQHCHVYYY